MIWKSLALLRLISGVNRTVCFVISNSTHFPFVNSPSHFLFKHTHACSQMIMTHHQSERRLINCQWKPQTCQHPHNIAGPWWPKDAGKRQEEATQARPTSRQNREQRLTKTKWLNNSTPVLPPHLTKAALRKTLPLCTWSRIVGVKDPK